MLSTDFLVPVLLYLRECLEDELLDLAELDLVHVEARAMRVIVFQLLLDYLVDLLILPLLAALKNEIIELTKESRITERSSFFSAMAM